jgi:MoaA/NifB/PqqE/SkfB family radical SAM enzyme
VRDALGDACELGYDTVSFSGGEPFLDPELPVLARYARDLGMRVTVTTNATVLTNRRLDKVASWLTGVAVSVDGPPAQHNQLRGTFWAFDRMQAGLAALRRRQITFGLIHTLTNTSIQHLPWLADFALAEGARLLHIHPLELTGRAAPELTDLHLATAPLERAYLAALFLAAAHRDRLTVQFDALLRAEILNHPEVLHLPSRGAGEGRADLPQILVIEPDGAVVPVAWGFSRRYAIASLTSERLSTGFSRWLTDGRAPFTSLGQQVFHMIETTPDLTVVNWLEWLVAQSHATGQRAPQPVHPA